METATIFARARKSGDVLAVFNGPRSRDRALTFLAKRSDARWCKLRTYLDGTVTTVRLFV